MTLEDFEKSLESSKHRHESHRKRSRSRDRDDRRRHRHHSSGDHTSRRHSRRDADHHRSHKRRRYSDDDEVEKQKPYKSKHSESAKGPVKEASEDEWVEKAHDSTAQDYLDDELETAADKGMSRSSWMQGPSADVEYKQARKQEAPKSKYVKAKGDQQTRTTFEPDEVPASIDEKREVDYSFGDDGYQWRMTKLHNVYRQAKESGMSVDDIAQKVYGDLRDFDDAREEEQELDRQKMYGNDYQMPAKPTGVFYGSRVAQVAQASEGVDDVETEIREPPANAPDQTELNRLKAKLMKARLKGGPDVAKLEAGYNAAVAAGRTEPHVVKLNAMDNRMLAGGRQGEVKQIDNKRGRERGLVEENDDMTIDDMVRHERRTRGQGEGLLLAERIAKDGKFTDNLDYMDENATKLARHVQKSDINLRNMAIEDFQKLNRILDSCQLCHHEDKGTGPTAPVVSLATRVYLTLPTEPELSEGGASIIPIQHHDNLLGCDEDEWEEIRNFMKSLTRMYHAQGREVIFYENAAAPHRKRHAAMEVVPLPFSLGETAPAFFREAILTADEEWSQHKKIIDTLARARSGLGRSAFRKTLVKEMPYFHVWFTLDGGIGHVVENSDKWPRGDLFAREVIGGMLDRDASTIKKQGRWHRGDKRVDGFRKRWKKFDWTRVLTEGQE